MTFQLGSTSQGITFLKWICMCLQNNLFAVIGIQYSGDLAEFVKTTTVVTGDITQSQ